MFNSTHTFVGLALARTSPHRWVPYLTVTAIIAANLPDIEIFTGLAGTPTYIQYHRGITHTFIGIPILSLALALGIYVFSGNFWRTFLVSLLVMATHPALDYANTYGLRPFLPFSGKWYYGDTLFIIDPILDLILLAGIIASYRVKTHRLLLAWASILIALAYIGGRVELRNQARAQLSNFALTVPNFESSAVQPSMLNPWRWDGVIETRSELIKVQLHALRGVERELARMPKSSPSEIIGHAASARSAAVFMGFARFPVTRVEETESGYRVMFIDFRFYNERTRTAFAAEVLLDQALDVVKDSLSFTKTVN
ncbi:MAG TPA: metal-dependent hydrolase [Terriglobia bacterium]|nr:metal-dependent hydrolase [Terriglobia bacterium]